MSLVGAWEEEEAVVGDGGVDATRRRRRGEGRRAGRWRKWWRGGGWRRRKRLRGWRVRGEVEEEREGRRGWGGEVVGVEALRSSFGKRIGRNRGRSDEK